MDVPFGPRRGNAAAAFRFVMWTLLASPVAIYPGIAFMGFYYWVHDVLFVAGVVAPIRGQEVPPSLSRLVAIGCLATALSGLSCWLLMWAAVVNWRKLTGQWWLRLTNSGFAVNTRVFRPRTYRWGEIEQFVVGKVETEDGGEVPEVVVRFSSGRADSTLMGYWDRPVEDAVDLMNEWLARYRGA